MAEILETCSRLSTPIILACGVLHLFVLIYLWSWCRRQRRGLVDTLDQFTREMSHRSVLERHATLDDQVTAFLVDVNELLEHPGRTEDRAKVRQRIQILDERRSYLQTGGLDSLFHLARAMIEAYPLAGVLGTVLAIGVVLQTNPAEQSAVSTLVQRFGESIWSTFAGLIFAIILMFVVNLLEPSYENLVKHRDEVRETVQRAKRILLMSEEPKP